MISIILPLRDEPNIRIFLSELHRKMLSHQEPYEVMVIMGDRETLHPELPPHSNQKVYTSYGDSLERAILLGFSVAAGARIVVMDTDGSHPIDKIMELASQLDNHSLVIGSRFLKNSEFETSFFRKIISLAFIKYAQFLGSHLSDPMSGFFALRKDILKNIKFKPFTWKTALEIELKSAANPTEIPIHFRKRSSGISKTKFKTGLKILWDILWERL